MPTQRLPRQASLEPLRSQKYRILPVPDVSTGGPPTPCQPTVTWADTFGMDDFLQIIYSVPFPDSFAVTEDALGVKVGLFDTVGIADQLSLVQIVGRFTDTFGADDQLTLATIVTRYIDTFGVDDSLLTVLRSIYADTFGMDDQLTLVTLQSFFTDTFALSDDALGLALTLFDTLGIDDRLTFVDLLTTYTDSFAADDQLTFADIAVVYADTVGIADQLAFVDLFTNSPDSFALTEDALGINVTFFDTSAVTEDLVPTVKPVWTEETFQYFDYKGASPLSAESLRIDDTAVLDVTGDIDIAIALIEADWSPAGFPVFVGKWGVAGRRSWLFEFDGSGTGKVGLFWSADGTATASTTMLVDTAPGFTDGEIGCLRVTLDVADGANRTMKYYKRTMTLQEVADGGLIGPLSDWTQFGSTETEAGNTSIFNSAAPITFGSQEAGASPTNKKIVGFAMRNGIEGTLVVDYRAADATSRFGTVNERANTLPVVSSGVSVQAIRSGYGPVLGFGVDHLSSVLIENWTCGRSTTKTFYLGSTNSDLTGGADFNKYLERVTETAGTIAVSVAASATETSRAFTRADESMILSAVGTYSVEIDVAVTNSRLQLSVQLHRVNAAGTVQTSSAASGEQSAGSGGVKLFTFASLNLGTWAVGDRLRVDYIFRNTVASVESVTINTGTTNTEVVNPLNPDGDPCGDAWIDQASPTTNHGNETPLSVKGKSTLSNDERQGRLKFDFRRYTGLTAKPGGSHTFTLRVTNANALLAVNFTMSLSQSGVTSPFTESTVTWNVPGSSGTLIVSTTVNIPANTTQDVVLTLTDAELNTLLGNWARIGMTTPTAAAPITCNVVSRESGTVADRPTFNIELMR